MIIICTLPLVNSPVSTCGNVHFIIAQIWFVLLNERSNKSKLARLNVKNQMKFSGDPRPHLYTR